MGFVKRWLERRYGQKSYSVQLLVGDDGFIVSPSFGGSDLYTVYTQAVWSYICARRISLDIGHFPAIVQRRKPGTDSWVRDTGHDLNGLIERPYGGSNAAPRWNWSQMIQAGVLRQELAGNQFYLTANSGSRLLMLALYLGELEPTKTLDGSKHGVPLGWHPSGNNNVEYSVDAVVNVMSPNPASYWSGVSPMVAAEQALRVDYAASRRMRYDMETRVAPGVVFKVKGLFTMSSAQRDATEKMLADSFEGATKAGKSLVVGDNTTIEGAPLHQVDDIPTMMQAARDSIISAFDVAPPTVGVLRDVKYQTWEQSLRAQFFLCVGPRLRNIYGTINSQAVWPVYGSNVRIWYDLVQSPLGLAALRDRGEAAKVYMDLGYPANAVNERFQLEMPEYAELDRPNMPAVVAGREPQQAGGQGS